MHNRPIQEILSSINLDPDNANFLPKVFSAICRERKMLHAKDGDNLKRVCAEEYDEISRRIDATGIQDSTSVRNVLRTRRLANLLINDKGDLQVDLLPRVITHQQNFLYSLGPNRQFDSKRQEHILKTLIALRDNKEIANQLRHIGKPHAHPIAEQIIRDTLQIPSNIRVTDAHARRAALSALMSFLRQNVGSCFATAPAIIIHDEQPELFLADIHEILSAGRLKRTFGGIEYAVPISLSSGIGDLKKPIVLNKLNPQSAPWYSPGIILALEAAELIDNEIALKEKAEVAKNLILPVYPEWNEENPMLVTTPEEILRRIIMQKFEVTAQDLYDYDHRPQAAIGSGLFQLSASVPIGGKGEAATKFYSKFTLAKNAFKSMSENTLLRSWEYTLASFSETKTEFTRWNLYFSLGLGPNEPGGIGQAIFQVLQQKLDQYNNKLNELQYEYEQLFNQVKQLEVRLQHAGNEREAQWVRVEYQTKVNEFHSFEEMRNKTHAIAGLLAGLFDTLIDFYDRSFPQYFQEVYDADLHEVDVNPFDDSPAGFRLLFKHGRANTAQWTPIKNADEYVESLVKFFTTTERELTTLDRFEIIQNEITDIVTSIVTHIRTKEFLESAFYRMAAAHKVPAIKDPLDNLNKIPMKPWAYISGGTVNTLLSCYFRREQKPTESSRWVENPMELLVFLVETLKQAPRIVSESYFTNFEKSMLMHSPTHAFLFKPGYSPFCKAWQLEHFTYTSVRDTMIKPMETFHDSLYLSEDKMDFLIQKIVEIVPINFKPYFKKVFQNIHGSFTSRDFREYIVDKLEHERGLQFRGDPIVSAASIDSILYALLPIFPNYQLKERLEAIFNQISGISSEAKKNIGNAIHEITERRTERLISAETLQDIALAVFLLATGSTATPQDIQEKITHATQELGFAMPTPIIFADTNWVRDYFAFLISPGTGMLELWRVDPLGKIGTPMSTWREWLNGSRKDIPWGVFPKPHEYTAGVTKDLHGKHIVL